MAKMTPGPWTAEQIGDTGGENPVDVWEINNGYTRIAEYVSDKDARLIAAAPELLEALKFLLEQAGLDRQKEAENKAYAVIAKAEGK
jgi:hypothetical protein